MNVAGGHPPADNSSRLFQPRYGLAGTLIVKGGAAAERAALEKSGGTSDRYRFDVPFFGVVLRQKMSIPFV